MSNSLVLRAFKEVWHNEIIKKNSYAKANQKKPLSFVLGGQPGAGKSSLTRQIYQSLDKNIVEINGDHYRKYHPNYKQFQEKFAKDSPKYTASFVGEMIEAVLQKAIQKRYNIVIEGTFRTVDTPVKTLKLLKKRGYSTSVYIKTCPKDESWQSCLERYEEMLKISPLEARYTDRNHHDLVTKNLAKNVLNVYKSGFVDNLKVFSRKKKLYDNTTKNEFDVLIIDNELNTKG